MSSDSHTYLFLDWLKYFISPYVFVLFRLNSMHKQTPHQKIPHKLFQSEKQKQSIYNRDSNNCMRSPRKHTLKFCSQDPTQLPKQLFKYEPMN